MTFVSFEFIVLFAIVLALYFVLNHKWQNLLLLVTNYVFYGWWDFRFLSLLILSSTIDFLCGLMIQNSTNERDRGKYLAIGLSFNLLTLCIFKYYDFFAVSLHAAFSAVGINVSVPVLNVILPIGISFYTFQTMSYTIDVYRREMPATDRFVDFLVFVGFFPHLVAGPILRAKTLLPQIQQPRKVTMEQFSSGAALMLWGYLKKIVIADNMGVYVDTVFSQTAPSGLDVMFATYAFAFQIYGDFSGYSDIARGCARMLGFDIMINFRLPLLAANPADFWRRWHISLSSWVRDYFYIPLGGSRRGRFRNALNLVVVMTVVGFWHGAAFHFILWGTFHGVLLLAYRGVTSFNQRFLGWSWGPNSALHWVSVLLFFNINCVGWLLFRANSATGQMLPYLQRLAHDFSIASFLQYDWAKLSNLPILAACLLIAELAQYFAGSLEPWTKLPAAVRVGAYTAAIYFIALFAPEKTLGFIYFAF